MLIVTENNSFFKMLTLNKSFIHIVSKQKFSLCLYNPTKAKNWRLLVKKINLALPVQWTNGSHIEIFYSCKDPVKVVSQTVKNKQYFLS